MLLYCFFSFHRVGKNWLIHHNNQKSTTPNVDIWLIYLQVVVDRADKYLDNLGFNDDYKQVIKVERRLNTFIEVGIKLSGRNKNWFKLLPLDYISIKDKWNLLFKTMISSSTMF